MARNQSKVDQDKGYIDTEYSSGDFNKMKSKQYQEENNNNIDELSKEFSEMGCIVDVVKRPPNICLETCVYEESCTDNDSDNETLNDNNEESHSKKINKDMSNNDEIIYSDEFDEDSDTEEKDSEIITASSANTSSNIEKTLVKTSKSCPNAFSNKPPSLSGRSSDFGPQTRRKNMSFTNSRLREIERHNHILLNKILSARNTKKTSIPPREQVPWRPVPSAAVHRKVQQRKIDHDNMILLKKIQRAKSSACSFRR